jgi:hypothetical protein
METFPRRGSRLSLDCSCEGRVVDWWLMFWGDRLFAVQLLGKGERCRIRRHQSGRRVAVRRHQSGRRAVYYDMLA